MQEAEAALEKRCSKCKKYKTIDNFTKDSYQISGLSCRCASCKKEDRDTSEHKKYMEEYRSTEEYKAWDKTRQSSVKYREKTNIRQRSKEHHEYQAQYRQKPEVKIKNAKRQKQRRDTDVGFKIGNYLRNRLNAVLNGRIKIGSAIKDLGCSAEELKIYLESKFELGMNWENWGNTYGCWQIDHKEELRFFDLTDREQFLKANHYTNLQPLWYENHMIKTANNTKRIK